MDLGEESVRPKAGHQGARGQHRAPRPPLPIQCPLSENGYEAQAPPAPDQKHGPANWPIRKWGFGGKEASGGGEGQDAQQPGLSAQGPLPISLGGAAAVWRPAVPSVHLGCANLCPRPAAGSWFLGVPGDGGGDTPSWCGPVCPLGHPLRSPSISPQVSCSYVGCGESFADHSTLHAQVSVVAGSMGPKVRQPRVQTPAPAAPWLHPPLWASEIVCVKWEQSQQRRKREGSRGPWHAWPRWGEKNLRLLEILRFSRAHIVEAACGPGRPVSSPAFAFCPLGKKSQPDGEPDHVQGVVLCLREGSVPGTAAGSPPAWPCTQVLRAGEGAQGPASGEPRARAGLWVPDSICSRSEFPGGAEELRSANAR